MSIDKQWHERIDVGSRVLTHTEDEHRARYAWAASKVAGRVLDVACGTGHGALLLDACSEVTGVDCDEGAVETARAKVAHATFIVAEVPPVPFDDATFEWVVSFETLEHIPNDAEFVAELKRVVTPGGHVLISSPNRAVTSPNTAEPSNPYHVREYLLPELTELVRGAGFDHVDMHFQRQERRRVPEYVAMAVIARIPKLCQPGRWWDRLGHGSSEVAPWSDAVTHPMFWVLDCWSD
jgi:ubiquinone/menaquinone biosynthesis C-methylase UbiE